jgi:hypothetical protein
MLVFLSFVYLIWYPAPLYKLHGTFDVVKLAVAVDLILGPLLTMIVFDIKKPRKELVRDLSIIVLIQLAALAWGVHMTLKVRPVFLVMHLDTLYSVTRDDINSSTQSQKIDMPVDMPGFWQKPRYIYTRPLDGEQAAKHVMEMITKGTPDVMYQTDKYLDMREHRDEVLAEAMDMSAYLQEEQHRKYMDEFIDRYGGTPDDYAFYPLEYGLYKTIVGIDRNSLSATGLLVPVNPG